MAARGVVVITPFTTVEVSIPSSPQVVGSLSINPTTTECYLVETIGAQQIAFVYGDGSGGDTLDVVDITDLADPQLLDSIALSSSNVSANPNMMVRHGDFLLLIRDDGSLRANVLEVIDISDLNNVSIADTFDLTTDFADAQERVNGIFRVGDTLVVGSIDDLATEARLGFYDISALPAIAQIDTDVVETGATNDLGFALWDAQGTVAYASIVSTSLGISRQLRTYNITTPGSVSLMDSLVFTGVVTGLSQVDSGVMWGVRLNSTLDVNLYSFDVSDPNDLTAPNDPGTAVTTSRLYAVRASGGKVYLGARKNAGSPNNRSVMVWDGSDPSAPTLDGEVVYNANGVNSWMVLAEEIAEPEVEELWQFPLHCAAEIEILAGEVLHSTVNVGQRIDSTELHSSTDVRDGEGTVVIVDVVSENFDGAR